MPIDDPLALYLGPRALGPLLTSILAYHTLGAVDDRNWGRDQQRDRRRRKQALSLLMFPLLPHIWIPTLTDSVAALASAP